MTGSRRPRSVEAGREANAVRITESVTAAVYEAGMGSNRTVTPSVFRLAIPGDRAPPGTAKDG